MDATVIVALPAVDDRVNKISSEKVPHLTLVYLPDLSNSDELQDVVEYVQHTASELSPFYLPVDYRDTLGPDEADVVFFEDNPWDLKRVKEFRNYLLLNDKIKRLYDSVEQYPEWTPHLTLGYPETPAHPDNSDYPGIHGVHFDRIAVWVGDFEGPEFRLKYDDYAMEGTMAMSTADRGAVAAAHIFGTPGDLAQSGVKGMKWGVRKDQGHEGEAVKTKKLGKLDKQWEKENTGVKGFIKVHNAVADRMNNGEIDKFNAEPRWKKAADEGVLNDDNHAETKAYFDAYESLTNKMFAEEAVKLGANPSGTKAYELHEDADGNPYAYLAPVTGEVKHAEGDAAPGFKLDRSDDGLVTGMTNATLELKHYGVKGMKWGVRKDVSTSRGGADSGPTAVVVTQKKPGTYAKSTGGKSYPLHDDAAVALAARQKARASKTDALSNAELRTAVERMQLEQRYNQLEFSSDRRSRGARFVAGLFGQRKPTKFKDMDEEVGEETRKAVKKAIAYKVAKTAATAAA